MILERRKSKALSHLALARFAGRAQRAAKLRGEVTVLLTGDEEIRELNAQFRRKDRPTDVLSFPADPVLHAKHAGDIAISLDTARVQAREMGHDLATEVKVLILHGMLHLAGYDHESDRGQMRRLESRLRAQLRLPAGLIERAAEPRSGRSC